MMGVVPFHALSPRQLEAAAEILIRALARWPSAPKTLGDARTETHSSLNDEERLALAAIEGEQVRGWIGAIKTYDRGWELHPLVVAPEHQGRGIGTQLVSALEDMARADNICTLYVGTDDEFAGTNIYGLDLYKEIARHIQEIAPAAEHPISFYRKLGFSVVGLLPDVNGPGKPDILLAKRL